jgi:AcrR family transcriptional regulator
MQERAQATEATRRRIVEATLTLHAERGVLATSHSDVAKLADVGVGTVYHHFPTLDAIVRACGAHVRDLYPLPLPESIDLQAPRKQRIEALARELVAFYARMPWLEKLRSERHEVPALQAGLSAREEAIRGLIRRAAGRISARKLRVIAAILDVPVITRLTQSMSQRDVAKALASVINSWLEGEQ